MEPKRPREGHQGYRGWFLLTRGSHITSHASLASPWAGSTPGCQALVSQTLGPIWPSMALRV